MCSCVCVCVYTQMFMCIWRPEVNIRYVFLNHSLPYFSRQSLTHPRGYRLSYTAVNPTDCSLYLQCWGYRHKPSCLTICGYLGSQLGPSSMPSKHFTD